MKRNKYDILLVGVTILLSILIIVISNMNTGKIRPLPYFKQEFVKGVVLEVLEEKIVKDPIVQGRYMGNQKIKIRLLQGKWKNEEFVINNTLSKQHNVLGKKGLTAIFTAREKDGKKIVWLYNYKRSHLIHLLLGIFLLLILVMGGIKGFKSILALIFTGVMIIYILIPMLFAGYDPIPIAISISIVIIFISFFLIGGINKKSLIAIAGTVFGVITAGILSYVFGKLARLSGINMENGEQVLYLATDYQIKVRGLMFISILISSLGAIMDVSMSIASSANELINLNKEINKKTLFFSLMNIGRDIMGTMTNTLILAFAGSSLTLIMMIWGYQMKYSQFVNIPVIAIEAIQAFSGSIGIILTVPFTAMIASISLKYMRRKKDEK